eukprot:6298799-Pyramimonas_sp.AAC.1
MPGPPVALDASSHSLETFSSNGGKKTIKKRLTRTTALVVIAQEIGHVDGDLEALNTWAGARGWPMLALPAMPSAGALPTTGAATCARSQCGLRAPANVTMQGAPRRAQH